MGRRDTLHTGMRVGARSMVKRRRTRLGAKQLRDGRRSQCTMLNSFRSVWRQEEFGDLLRRSFSSNALLKRTTKNQDRDVDLYHWSSAKFESTWRDTFSVLIARGRAQVGVHSAKSDWSRRILDFAYMDYDDQAAHHE